MGPHCGLSLRGSVDRPALLWNMEPGSQIDDSKKQEQLPKLQLQLVRSMPCYEILKDTR